MCCDLGYLSLEATANWGIFFCLGFLVSGFSIVQVYFYIFWLYKTELFLRIKLSVVTLGKSLPGSKSKLGHFLPGLSCQ